MSADHQASSGQLPTYFCSSFGMEQLRNLPSYTSNSIVSRELNDSHLQLVSENSTELIGHDPHVGNDSRTEVCQSSNGHARPADTMLSL